ncbi:hypothetical protein GCM10010449_05310 [Streptomyces rectiviolaceus]|uniref:Uncharacterized protein n=2 Tax=Streptomyces rectiviolaceus TaxID=332591 RepID=A0ABP6M6Z0_9ACTN
MYGGRPSWTGRRDVKAVAGAVTRPFGQGRNSVGRQAELPVRPQAAAAVLVTQDQARRALYERVDACPHCRPDTVLGVLDWLWCFGQGRKVWRPPCGRFRLVWIRSRVDGGSMTIKKLVARATAVALLATGGLAVGTGAATAGGSHGAPGAGVAPMGDGSGSPGGGLAPMGPGGASGGGFAPADHEWGVAPAVSQGAENMSEGHESPPVDDWGIARTTENDGSPGGGIAPMGQNDGSPGGGLAAQENGGSPGAGVAPAMTGLAPMGDNAGSPGGGLVAMGDNHGAPGGGAAPMGDGHGSPGGSGVAPRMDDVGMLLDAPRHHSDGHGDRAVPLGDNSGAPGGGFAPAEHDWGVAPMENGSGSPGGGLAAQESNGAPGDGLASKQINSVGDA